MQVFDFGPFRLDPPERALLCEGQPVPLAPKALDLLVVLVSRAGHLVTKEELLREVWPGTFVEEANLSYTVSLIRKALKDEAEPHRYIETVPRAGYRFIESVTTVAQGPDIVVAVDSARPSRKPAKAMSRWIAIGSLATAAMVLSVAWQLRRGRDAPPAPTQRVLRRLTFDPGLQMQPTWSPDARFIAFSSDRSGNFDIWVQPVAGGDAIQVTKDPAHDWQPDWSPDGSQLVFRSERQGGGLYLVRALGGDERKLADFGFTPRWSPDGTRLLLSGTDFPAGHSERPRMYVVRLDGGVPQRILPDFLDGFDSRPAVAWHPDGQRLSFWGARVGESWALWTVPVDGGATVRSELTPSVRAAMSAASLEAYGVTFAWEPGGDTVFFTGSSLEVRNIWRVGVEPKTLRWTSGPERLTTGPGADTDLALSRDGRSVAFGTSTRNARVWVFSFDPVAGRITDGGQAVTPQEMSAWGPDITRDGRKVLFQIEAPGRTHRHELVEHSLTDGTERRLAITEIVESGSWHIFPRWSPDGTRVSYRLRTDLAPGQQASSIRVLETATGLERQVTSPWNGVDNPRGWSSDGQWLVASSPRYTRHRQAAIALVPLSAAPHAESKARVVTSDDCHGLYQAVLSPDDRWIAFQAASRADISVSTLYVLPAGGGGWTQITEGLYWDDKPRWSPDGKTLYFVSSRRGVFNVWGIRFDPSRGLPMGEAFPVTSFESPRRMLNPSLGNMEMAVARDRLVLNLVERTGGIWVLENVAR